MQEWSANGQVGACAPAAVLHDGESPQKDAQTARMRRPTQQVHSAGSFIRSFIW